MANHDQIYDAARYYHIAFSFRDVPKECDMLARTFENAHGRAPGSVLELAAGPAEHALEFATRDMRSVALDISEGMQRYALECAEASGVSLDYRCADMRSFSLEEPVDIALTLMDSASYLLTNDDVLAHFEAVSRALVPGGLYILEMAHPKQPLRVERAAGTSWEQTVDGVRVVSSWGRDDDPFDPITQITKVTTEMRVFEGEDETASFRDVAPMRCFTATEWDALVRASGCFRIRELFGSLDRCVPFNNEKRAWRMVSVLQSLR